MDLNREELRLIIFANWRGFSGGLRDLYQEILKFGSYIVDALRTYRQPVIIYIPPNGELRGGAWVVLDATINPRKMEMYCDDTGRGGVLEPTGTVEIKYKDKDVITTMHRLDPLLMALDAQLKATDNILSKEQRRDLEKRQKEREALLMGMYGQVATSFADLQDTPGRMKAKDVIREVLSWKTSRSFLHHRINRRVREEYLKRDILNASPGLDEESAIATLRSWLAAAEPKECDAIWADDKRAAAWFTSQHLYLQEGLQALKATKLREEARSIVKVNPMAGLEGLLTGLGETNLLSGEREALRSRLQEALQKLA